VAPCRNSTENSKRFVLCCRARRPLRPSVATNREPHMRAVPQDNERDPNGSNAIFSQILCAIADYDVFIQLMRETKEKEDEDQSSEEELNGK